MWNSRQAYASNFPQVSLFTKGDNSAKRSLQLFVSDKHLFGIFIPLPTGVLIGYPQEANISLVAAVSQFFFLRALCVMFHSRFQSTLIPFPPSIRLK